MPSAPEPVELDLEDFDAVGIAGEIVVALRRHAIEASVDAVASVSAPSGWHGLFVTGRPSGHVVLGVRYRDLTPSRWHNVTRALAEREWLLDEDGEGASRRYPPGAEATTVAFEILTALTLSGAPTDPRQVTAVDASGDPVPLR
jgi:hypothetical protein